MAPLIRANPLATALIIATFLAALLAEWVVTFRTRRAEARGPHHDGVGLLRAAAAALAEVNLLRTRETDERDHNTKQVLLLASLAGILLGWLAATRSRARGCPGARGSGSSSGWR